MKTTDALDHAFVQTLFDERLPRGEETVERFTAEAAARTKRLARTLALALVVFFVVAMSFIARDELAARSGPDLTSLVTVSVTILVFGGLLPFFVIGRIIRRDLKSLARLARDGIAFHPTELVVVSRRWNRDKLVRLFWDENGKEASADFELSRVKVEPVDAERMCVLARPRDKYVIALLGGNGVFVGRRRVVLWGR